MNYDIAIVGGGPAGLAAALNGRRRNKEVVVIGKETISSKLLQSHMIENYLGFPQITGPDLGQQLLNHAQANGTVFIKDQIQQIYGEDKHFQLFGREHQLEATTVILATGVSLGAKLPGESDFVGRGVSYCATCDGMFFKGKPVALIGYIREAETEAEFLAEICSSVYYLPLYSEPGDLDPRITIIGGKPLAITGSDQVNSLQTTAGEWQVSGVFLEKAGQPIAELLPDLHIEGEFIVVDGNQATNIPGVFAAGDCTGKPWQISHAVGQGQVAALNAVAYLSNLK